MSAAYFAITTRTDTVSIKSQALLWTTILLFCSLATGAISLESNPVRRNSRQSDIEPKILLYSAVNEWWLKDTIDRWAKSGFAGFIITNYVQWFTPSIELESHRLHFADLVSRGAPYGITENFIDVQLAARRYADGGALPAWHDETAWTNLLTENFPAIARFAKTTGFKGIVFDTEPYAAAGLWKVAHPRNGGRSKAAIQEVVYNKGKRLMAAMQQAYPGIQIILLQEGSLWSAQSDLDYELWPSFYNGMASTQPTPGIIIGTESTYPENGLLEKLKRNPDLFIRNQAALIEASMYSIAELPEYWKAKGSLAIGMWPLGASYSDKSARYAPAVFEAQMRAAKAVSGKYVWVYGHGNAWWRMTEQEVNAYSTEPWHYTFDKASQVLPPDANIEGYFAVVRSNRHAVPVLK